ncbi:MAG: tandem-95 repeat protein, partial [Candidatus Latescibacteria bacterium]|nr:tandem-95 repeat protein [Candidatus Latescibacterota bacterium]
MQEHVGDTTVSVEVSDGVLMDTLTYTLTVLPTNDPPVVIVPDTTFAEDGVLVLDMKPLVDDVDDADNQIIWSVSGTSALTATITDTVITLEALEDFEGSEQITFTATDPGGLSHSDVATITVTPVNDPPVIFGTPDTTATEGVDYTFTVEASDDADGDVVSFALLTAPGGMVIDASTGVISWLPNQANVGDTTVSVRAFDPSGAADTLTYTLIVLNTNSAPSIAIGDQSFDEDDSLTIDMSVLVDDVDDTNGDLLIEVSGNSNIVVIVTGQSVKLKAQSNYSGVEQLTFTVRDTSGASASDVATVTVDPVNDLPVITNGPDTTATESVDYTLDLDGADVDGDVLTWSLPVAPTGMVINAATGEISWLPGQADVGSGAVTAKVVDPSGGADSLSWTLTVLPSNSPPVVSALADTSFDEDATLVLNMNAVVTDPDNPDAEITWSVSGNTEITVTIADSLITLGTTLDFNGSEQLTFTATDAGGLSHSATATLTVNPMNDKPDITSAPDTTATEGVDYTLDVDALDVDGDVLTWSLPVAPGGMVINTATGLIDWLPTQVNVGDTTVTVKVVDVGGAADSLSFTLTVLPSNGPPVVSALADTSFDEDATLVLNMNAVVTDPDNPDAEITWSVSGNTEITVTIADSLITLGTT